MRKGIFLLTVFLLSAGLLAEQGDSAPGGEMAVAAGQLLASMDNEQREPAGFMINSEERTRWHYVPRRRAGFRMTEMTAEQREQALALVRTGLSEKGFERAEGIRWLDGLRSGGRSWSQQGARVYYFTFFNAEGFPGAPPKADFFTKSKAWGWRVEGHHLSLNFTLKDGKVISSAPLFMGADPATVPAGERKGLRVLKEEEDWGRRLFKSFTGAERAKVLIRSVAPRDIVTRNSVRADIGKPAGVSYGEMTAGQQDQLLRLIDLYIYRLRRELGDKVIDRMGVAGLEDIHFAWAGGSEPGEGHYYRIHGTTFLIEYDNTQGGANHIHTVWRDSENDFGLDLLKEHYARAAHHQSEVTR